MLSKATAKGNILHAENNAYMKRARRALVKPTVLLVSIIALSAAAPNWARAEMTLPDPMSKLTDITSKISKKTNGRLNLSGYFNGHYMNHNGTANLQDSKINVIGGHVENLDEPLMQLREFSLFADVLLTDNLIFSSEVELGDSGRKLRGNYAYLDFDLSSQFDTDTDKYGNFTVRAGKVLVPFLSYNENKPNFRQNLMSQPFTALNISPVNPVPIGYEGFGWSDFGATLNWNKFVGETGIVGLKVTAMNGLRSSGSNDVYDANSITLQGGPTVRPRDGSIQNGKWDLSDNNDDIATNVKLSYQSTEWPLEVGGSWYRGKWDDAGNHDLKMYGVYANYLEKDWTLKTEIAKTKVEQTAGVNPVGGGPALNVSTGDYDMFAWYLEGSYIPYRYGSDGEQFVRLIARYDTVDTNDQAAFTPFDRDRITVGSEWEFLPQVRLRYEFQKHTIHSFQNAPAPYIAAGGDENIYMNMVSLIGYF